MITEKIKRLKEYNNEKKEWIKRLNKTTTNMKRKHRKCPLCGKNNTKTEIKTKHFNFTKCQCGLLYATNTITNKELNKFYKNNKAYQEYWKIEYENLKRNKERPMPQYIKNIIPQLPITIYKLDKAMDIGCSFGEGLHHLKGYFNKIEGIEPNEDVARKGKEIYNIQIHTKTPKYEPETYDLIILEQVIEHLNDLKPIEHATKMLKKGGLLYIGCPNADSTSMKIFKEKNINFETIAHINMFNEKSIQKLAEKYGYEIKEIKISPELEISITDLIRKNRKDFIHTFDKNIIDIAIETIIRKTGIASETKIGGYIETTLKKRKEV